MKRSILESFVVLSPGKTATIEKNDTALYQRLDANYDDFQGHELIACHEFDSDWPTWEVHPHGDEIVILMSGSVTLVLDTPQGEESTVLDSGGDYVLVPRNIWHTAKTDEGCRLLFVTPGQGTQNRAI